MSDPSKLDRLLDLRRHEEQRRTVELALARQALDDAEAALTKLQEQRHEVERVLDEVAGESVGQVQTLRLVLEQLDVGIQNANTVRALAAATTAEKEEQYRQASRNRETLERIVVPRHEAARALERIAERKQEDEAALTRFRSQGHRVS